MDGYSSYRFKDGSTYAGFWKNGEFHGFGKKTNGNGSVYSGFWEQGKKHGKGKLFWQDNSYEGSWEDNQEHGRGVQVLGNGDRYDGWFFEGERSGKGKLTYSTGASLEGIFKNGEIYTGTGMAVSKEGTARIGEFQHGALQGPGRVVWKTGTTIEGDFRDGQVCGICTVSYTNGDVYQGEWAPGQGSREGRGREGQGRLVYANGKVLEGVFWRNAILHGTGMQVSKAGVEEEGQWQDGQLIVKS